MMTTKHTCCERLYSGRWSNPCHNKAKVERDGKWYCGTHDPVAVMARQDKRNAEFRAKMDYEMAIKVAAANKQAETQRRADCYDELLEALRHTAAVCAGETSTKNGLINALEKARAALKKATGEVK